MRFEEQAFRRSQEFEMEEQQVSTPHVIASQSTGSHASGVIGPHVLGSSISGTLSIVPFATKTGSRIMGS